MNSLLSLDLYEVFVAIAETRTMTAAARRLRTTKATVSRSLAKLEEALDTRLVLRSPRSLSLSPAGETLYEQIVGPLSALRQIDVVKTDQAPKGKLRVTTAIDFGQLVLSEAVALCRRRHPELELEVRLSNAFVDMTAEGFDVGIRLSTGPLRDSSMVAKKVGTVALGAFAAPTYLARRGMPKVIGAPEHAWLVHAILRRGLPARLHPEVVADDMIFLRELAVRGSGVAILSRFAVADELVAGRLVEVLVGDVRHTANVYVVHPASGRTSRAVQAFRDVVSESLRARPLPL